MARLSAAGEDAGAAELSADYHPAAGEDAGADELSADYHPAAGEDAGAQEPPAAATAHGVIQGSGPSPNSNPNPNPDPDPDPNPHPNQVISPLNYFIVKRAGFVTLTRTRT